MIVFYNKENTLSLPYNKVIKVHQRDDKNRLVFDKDGNPKLINKDTAKYFKFIPGKNTISKELWLKIVEYNKEDMEYYKSILSVFMPEIDEKTQEEIGKDESEIDLRSLNQIQFKDLIKNTMDLADISKYLKFEKGNKARPQVLKVIKKRQAQINKADEAIFKEREGD